MKKRSHIVFILLFIACCSVLLTLLFTSRPHKGIKPTWKSHQVQAESHEKKLFFTGTIQPIREYTLTNPLAAVVETMHYHYGQSIKKNSVVFTLKSSELQKQYNEALTEYLKAKDTYTVAQAKFAGTSDLWKSGLLSKNNFLSEKSSLNNARVSFVQSSRKLHEMIAKIGDASKNDFSSLSLGQFAKVQNALSSKHDKIFLRASGAGVLLHPPKSSDDKSERLTIGSSVKAGQVIGLIGDLSGLRIEIEVSEVDIDKVKPGMQALVKSVAFPKETLTGELVAINAQASSNSANSLPSFSAIVEIKQLTPAQQAWVKVGMSATIELTAQSGSQLTVPIAAVRLEKGQTVVTLKDQHGALINKSVITGPAQADKVIIESGLCAGDVVVYNRST